jgi:hypothetical protein
MLQDALQDHQCYQNLGIMGGWNFFFSLMWVFGQFVCTSTNSIGPEVNDHVSLQWSSYE